MIEAKQVRYGIRSREILRGVDFRVEKGNSSGSSAPTAVANPRSSKTSTKVLRPPGGGADPSWGTICWP